MNRVTDETAPPAEALIGRIDDVLPLLRDNAPVAEALRRVPDENIEALTDAGVFRMTVPRYHGGYESSLAMQYDVLETISRACPSTGWVTTILTAMLWVTGMFPDEAQDEVYSTTDARVASVIAPGGTASRRNGGVVVSGRWPFNTGCHNAQWAILSALIQEDGTEPSPVALLIPYADLTILNDWDATGMAGTGSNTTLAEGVFVPEHRIASLPRLMSLDLPTIRNADNPYYRMPMVSLLIAQASAAPVGVARGALEAFMNRLPGRAITYTTYTDQSKAPVTHVQVAEAAMTIESADAHARRSLALVEEAVDGVLPLEIRARVRAHAGYATQLARRAVDILFQASGASATQAGVPIQRYQRDIQALANHAFLTGSTTLELYGRVLCGLEPNTEFI